MKIFLNWKQNGSCSEIESFIKNIALKESAEVSLFLPFPYLSLAKGLCQKFEKNLVIAAQNVSPFLKGAYTGEVGAEMLRDIGITKVLVGHSERRMLFNENDDTLSKKIKILQNADITPVLCIGETNEDRAKNIFLETLKKQLEIYKPGCVLAYEPIWSIGSGIIPLNSQIEEVAEFIKKYLGIKILYGGSVNEENIYSILRIPNIEGVLIGNASLSFLKVNKMLDTCW